MDIQICYLILTFSPFYGIYMLYVILFTMTLPHAFLGSFLLGISLFGVSSAGAWEYQDFSVQQVCIPQMSVVDNAVDNTVLIRLKPGNACPISNTVFLFIQDNRPQPLKLPGIRENFISSTWVVRLNGVLSGRYRVMGINPTPDGIDDVEYISARRLQLDQVITIGQGQEQSAPISPPVLPPPAPRQEVLSEQPPQVALDDESKRLIHELLEILQWFKEALLRLQAALNQTS